MNKKWFGLSGLSLVLCAVLFNNCEQPLTDDIGGGDALVCTMEYRNSSIEVDMKNSALEIDPSEYSKQKIEFLVDGKLRTLDSCDGSLPNYPSAGFKISQKGSSVILESSPEALGMDPRKQSNLSMRVSVKKNCADVEEVEIANFEEKVIDWVQPRKTGCHSYVKNGKVELL